jgi:NADPH-dependent 2,4-dienoyl-CoA reductase/sulfur reductase-like enzyme
LAAQLVELVENDAVRSPMQAALARWHAADAAERIAGEILSALKQTAVQPVNAAAQPTSGGEVNLKVMA